MPEERVVSMSQDKVIQDARNRYIELLKKLSGLDKVVYYQKLDALQCKVYRLRYLNRMISESSPDLMDFPSKFKQSIKKIDYVITLGWIIFLALIFLIDSINLKIIFTTFFIIMIIGAICAKALLHVFSSLMKLRHAHFLDEKDFLISQIDYSIKDDYEFDEDYYYGDTKDDTLLVLKIKTEILSKISDAPY